MWGPAFVTSWPTSRSRASAKQPKSATDNCSWGRSHQIQIIKAQKNKRVETSGNIESSLSLENTWNFRSYKLPACDTRKKCHQPRQATCTPVLPLRRALPRWSCMCRPRLKVVSVPSSAGTGPACSVGVPAVAVRPIRLRLLSQKVYRSSDMPPRTSANPPLRRLSWSCIGGRLSLAPRIMSELNLPT